METKELIDLIKKDPYDEKLNKYFKKLDVFNWCEILEEQPNLIDKCDKIHVIDKVQWVELICKQPKLLDYYYKPDGFSDLQLFEILSKQPNLIKNKNILLSFNYMDEDILLSLLKKHPKLIKYIDTDLDNIKDLNYINIIYYSKKYRIEAIKKYLKNYNNPEVLTYVINIYPDLKNFYTKNNLWEYVDFNQLSRNLEYSILK